MSEKSLQICTESLGSETGSDGFSSYSPSEIGDGQEDKEEGDHQERENQQLDIGDGNYNYCVLRKSSPRSFPPSLPSLSHRQGTSLHMQSRREGGRLVLEAVTIQSQNYFQADRENGRLLLTFVSNSQSHHDEEVDEEEEFEQLFESETEPETDEEDDVEEEEDEEDEICVIENGGKSMRMMMDQAPKLSSGVINVHRSAFVMKNLMGILNKNPTNWTPNHKFNKAVHLMDMEVEEDEEMVVAAAQLPQSLPPRPRVARLIPKPPAVAAAASFNAYEYFWRTKPEVASSMINPLIGKNSSNKVMVANTCPKAYEKQDLVLLRGNKTEDHDLVHSLRRNCKEPRRSLLFWEPYCIATS